MKKYIPLILVLSSFNLNANSSLGEETKYLSYDDYMFCVRFGKARELINNAWLTNLPKYTLMSIFDETKWIELDLHKKTIEDVYKNKPRKDLTKTQIEVADLKVRNDSTFECLSVWIKLNSE